MERKSLFTHFIECFTQNYFNFSGRARRREYWGFLLFFSLLSALVIVFFTAIIAATGGDLDYIKGVIMITYLLCYLPMLAVQVRRLHDRGMSGWWVFCSSVLGVIFNVYLNVMPRLDVSSDARLVPLVSLILVSVVLNIYLFVQTLMDGEVGANKYGEDPKASERFGTHQG